MPKFFTLDSSMLGSKGWTSTQQKKLESIITAGVKQLGRAVFVEAQRRVPVVTGNLKSSGSITFPDNGFEINYSATYAMNVEVGRRASEGAVASQPWVSEVAGFWRMSRTKGRKYIKKHRKTYLKAKPIKMPDGQWRTFSTSSISRGKHFVGGSLQTLLKGSFSTNNGFQKYLQTDTI